MGRKFLSIFIGTLLFGLCAAGDAHAQWVKEMCPVMPGTHGKSNLAVDYRGTTYYLCCGSCVRSFKKNPDKYLRPSKP